MRRNIDAEFHFGSLPAGYIGDVFPKRTRLLIAATCVATPNDEFLLPRTNALAGVDKFATIDMH
jgi:hypothetical protein